MRTLFVSPAGQLGGAERCLLDCVAALSRAPSRVEVHVLLLAGGPLIEKCTKLGATVNVLEPPRGLAELGESGLSPAGLARGVLAGPSTMRFLRLLRRSIDAFQPDVIHTNGMKAHILAGVVAPSCVRQVVHLHDFVGARKASRWLLPALAHVPKRVVFMANSHAVASDFARLAPAADIRTVYNVVDTDYFRPGNAEPEWLESSTGTPQRPGVVSFGLVATYARWKGHQLFIEAAGRLHDAHPHSPVGFYVVGGPIYETRGSQVCSDDLLLWARSAGIKEFFKLIPFQEDIARVYRSLNVVVHTSTEPEPFGRTIAEAMACGRPVIVSNEGGAAELFQHGENALGFTPRDARELAKTMSRMLDPEVRTHLAEAAHRHALEQFGPGRLGEQLHAVYCDRNP